MTSEFDFFLFLFPTVDTNEYHEGVFKLYTQNFLLIKITGNVYGTAAQMAQSV